VEHLGEILLIVKMTKEFENGLYPKAPCQPPVLLMINEKQKARVRCVLHTETFQTAPQDGPLEGIKEHVYC
jgi:hypothetical protein